MTDRDLTVKVLKDKSVDPTKLVYFNVLKGTIQLRNKIFQMEIDRVSHFWSLGW